MQKCISPEDNAPHHYLRAMEALENGKIDIAMEKFERALYCDERFSMAHSGHERSPFPDVRTPSPLYNALMNMTTRGIMEPELSGEFRIDAPVDGAEALLAIRVLKQRMNIY